MTAGSSNRWALYGGAGFIGQHLALSILSRYPNDCVCILDLQSPTAIAWKVPMQPFIGSKRLRILQCDVRDRHSLKQTADHFDVMANLAAVHREPGHQSQEYFETNVAGAENICQLADEIGCREIVFTSSISVYGSHDDAVDEDSAVNPRTAYGQSKHQAEAVHRAWAATSGGRLAIIRPGVVFGPGEGGNVTRLVSEMLKRQRVIRIQPDQPKAGIYINELIDLIHWLRTMPLAEGTSQLVNGVSNDLLTFNAYGQVLKELRALDSAALTVPGSWLRALTALLNPFAGLFPTGSKLHPHRLRKLTLANNIRPSALCRMGYPFNWPLDRALADWLEKGV